VAKARNPGAEPERYTREDLRQDLLRGVVTEPLLTNILKSPGSSFDIIIALNELFPEGLDKAAEGVEGELNKLQPKPERMARAAPELGPDRLARIVHAIITESLDAVD